MIQVKVELWPGGNSTAARQIADIRINSLSDLADVSNFRFIVSADGQPTHQLGGAAEGPAGTGSDDKVLGLIERVLLHILKNRRGGGFYGL